MSSTAVERRSSSAVDRNPSPAGLYEIVDVILDKGLVIDAYVRVSVVGLEVLTVDARIVVASVDTYLHFAESVDRLKLSEREPKALPDVFSGETTEKAAEAKTKGAMKGGGSAIKGGAERLREAVSSDGDNNEGSGSS